MLLSARFANGFPISGYAHNQSTFRIRQLTQARARYSLHLKPTSESGSRRYELPVKPLIGTRPIQELSSPDGGDDPCAIGLPDVARQSPHAP